MPNSKSSTELVRSARPLYSSLTVMTSDLTLRVVMCSASASLSKPSRTRPRKTPTLSQLYTLARRHIRTALASRVRSANSAISHSPLLKIISIAIPSYSIKIRPKPLTRCSRYPIKAASRWPVEKRYRCLRGRATVRTYIARIRCKSA